MTRDQFEIYFLSPNTPAIGAADRRASEVARSEARSHAARISYPRRQRPSKSFNLRSAGSEAGSSPNDAQHDQLDDKSPSGSPTSPAKWRFRLYVSKEQDTKHRSQTAFPLGQKEKWREKIAEKEQSQPSPATVAVPKSISKSALDPFAQSAIDLSVPDEHLLHIYLSTVPDQIYGSTSGPVSTVAHHSTVGVVATNAIVVMWLLLVIESQIVSFQPSKKDRALSILTRKSQVYKLMNDRLVDQNSSLADDYVLAVAIAGGCEHRMGNSKGAEHHVRATRELLRLRGGTKAVRDITYPLGLMVVNVFVENGVKGLWESLTDLRIKQTRLSQWVQDLQIWNHNIRKCATHTSPPGFCYHPELDTDFKVARDSESSDHLIRRGHAFGKGTALFSYVDVPSDNLDDAQCRFYLGVLYAINNALWAFRHSERTGNEYLKGLATAVNMSAPSNLALRAGGAKLPSLLMVLMVAHHAVEVEERNESTNTVFHVEEVFEFVEMIMMASPEVRRMVVRTLSSWLTTAITNVRDLAFISLAKLDILEGEVEDQWFSERPR